MSLLECSINALAREPRQLIIQSRTFGRRVECGAAIVFQWYCIAIVPQSTAPVVRMALYHNCTETRHSAYCTVVWHRVAASWAELAQSFCRGTKITAQSGNPGFWVDSTHTSKPKNKVISVVLKEMFLMGPLHNIRWFQMYVQSCIVQLLWQHTSVAAI